MSNAKFTGETCCTQKQQISHLNIPKSWGRQVSLFMMTESITYTSENAWILCIFNSVKKCFAV